MGCRPMWINLEDGKYTKPVTRVWNNRKREQKEHANTTKT